MAKRPIKRPEMPARNSDNDKRRLDEKPEAAVIAGLLAHVRYNGSSKHKQNPHLFELPPFNSERGDETLCDKHANFSVRDMASIQKLLTRGINAGLIGGRMLWTIADNGWIFEARLTNQGQHDYHGYPVRSTEAIAKPVYERFAAWAGVQNKAVELAATQACAARYGF